MFTADGSWDIANKKALAATKSATHILLAFEDGFESNVGLRQGNLDDDETANVKIKQRINIP